MIFPCPNPKCNGMERRVLESRYQPSQSAMRRRCICQSCGLTFTTQERAWTARRGRPPKVSAVEQPLTSTTFAARLASAEAELAEVRLAIAGRPTVMPIQDLELGMYAYNSLKRQGIHTINALLKLSSVDLLNLRNFGHQSLVDVQVALALQGLALRQERASPYR